MNQTRRSLTFTLMQFLVVSTLFLQTKNLALGQLPSSNRLTNWKDAGYQNAGKLRKSYQIIDFVAAGGIADGITPNDSFFKQIYAAVNHDSCLIYFPKGSFYFEKSFNLLKPIVLKGHSSDSTKLIFRQSATIDLIFAVGSKLLPNVQINENITQGSDSIVVASTATFRIGDDVEITENDSSLAGSSWSFRKTGQINQIKFIAGNTIFLIMPMRRSFNAMKDLRINKLRMKKEIGLENFKIIRLDSTAGQTTNIDFTYTKNCWIKCIESENCNFSHVSLTGCSNIEVTGSYFHHSFGYGPGGRAYGIAVQYASGQCKVERNIFKHLRHSMLLQAGANGNVIAYNYSSDPFWTQAPYPSDFAGDIVLHGNYPYANLIEGNTVFTIVIDNSHGINGPFNTIFRNRMEGYGLLMSSIQASDNQNIIANEISDTAVNYGFYVLAGAGHFVYGNNVKGNILPQAINILPPASLYLDTVPNYYATAWPPIGIPNSLSAQKIEAENRMQNRLYTFCADNQATALNDKIQKETNIIIFPNPTNEMLNIPFQGRKTIVIHDNKGTCIQIIETEERFVSMKMLISGLYHIRILDQKMKLICQERILKTN